jgi:trichothecene 3-O-acetyltransferase
MDEYNNLDRYQDNALGQLPMLQAYSHLMYLFPLPGQASQEEIVRDLSEAVTKVREAVPWIGARVINVDKTGVSSGVYRPVSSPFPSPAVDVADATSNDVVPTYAELGKAKAPLSKIDTQLFTRVPGFPVKCDVNSDERPAHVVRVQATFIQGGVLVDFAIAHNMADARGHLGFIRLVATAMRGEPFPESVLTQACLDRRNAVPLLGDDEPTLDHSHHRRAPVTADAPLTPKQPARYHIFRFTAASMAALKELAGRQCVEGEVDDSCATDERHRGRRAALGAVHLNRRRAVRLLLAAPHGGAAGVPQS